MKHSPTKEKCKKCGWYKYAEWNKDGDYCQCSAPQAKGWEKEFDKWFEGEFGSVKSASSAILYENIRGIFEYLLQQQKKEMRDDDREEELWSEGIKEGRRQMKKEILEKIGSMKRRITYSSPMTATQFDINRLDWKYNEAIDQIKSIIEKL